MKVFRLTSRYKRDYKRIAKRGYDLALFDALLDQFAQGEALPAASRDHALKGEWSGFRECHVEPDWLLIYKTTDAEVLLARTGTHADLFSQ
jgi:mRNA interferase YafQ